MGRISEKVDRGLQSGSERTVIFTPLKLHPHYDQKLWGGNRLKSEFGKLDAPDITAESWELACHPDGSSEVAEGPLQGLTLDQLGQLDRVDFWGTACPPGTFPILVKLIDAKQMLSIQVHPSDENALPGEQGKAEMWYIVDCEPQSFLYFGFSRRVTREEMLWRAVNGTICEVLNRVSVSKGDVFYIMPGTIHAIGAGIVIAEIQQNSNTTFRVYDYNRRGPDGKLRPLHLERAADVASYVPIIPEECRANSVVSFPEFTMTEMFSCRYFRAYRIDVRESVKLHCEGQSFQHILCVEGSGFIEQNSRQYSLSRGDSFFMPAAMGDYRICGVCRVLLSRI